MPSDKCRLIMAKARGLFSSLFNVSLSGDVPFLPTTAAPVHASWLYQSLPLLSFELHSFIHCRVGDDFEVHALWLQCETKVSAGCFLRYSSPGMLLLLSSSIYQKRKVYTKGKACTRWPPTKIKTQKQIQNAYRQKHLATKSKTWLYFYTQIVI